VQNQQGVREEMRQRVRVLTSTAIHVYTSAAYLLLLLLQLHLLLTRKKHTCTEITYYQLLAIKATPQTAPGISKWIKEGNFFFLKRLVYLDLMFALCPVPLSGLVIFCSKSFPQNHA